MHTRLISSLQEDSLYRESMIPQPNLVKKESKRRKGNQGDCAKVNKLHGELPEHKDWNAQVEAKKLRKGK